MFANKRKQQANFSRNSSASANRRKIKRNMALKKVLWRQRTFAIREFAMMEENY
ncbi:hypothetical protein [Enterovibrio paralichthyis]|uniref:hypothetical protein n=1 Tax=Enterovibrio paralichthyis TaxID=2853805 RepID=UPI001C43F1BF|nr:hypothetical protein [Enterovibrio paralichthyis]MBV7299091.1 hypothetical protein [Enterovibrio paralichthyis]